MDREGGWRVMKKRSRLKEILIVSFMMTLLPALTILAGSRTSEQVMQTVSSDSAVKMYIRDLPPDSGDVSFQVQDTICSEVRLYPVTEDQQKPRTLIMLDNSVSIPDSSRQRILDLLSGIIDGHADGELFRLAYYSDSIQYRNDSYCDDYEGLKEIISQTSYSNQETYLTDVLADVINELDAEDYYGYTRIIVISDGVDNKQLGLTREELNDLLDESPYPVYTIGCETGKNEQLENMFAISRKTHADSFVLEQTDTGVITEDLAKDHALTVMEARLPEAAMSGERKLSRLTAGGQTYSAEIDTPFPQLAETAPETLSETSAAETEIATEWVTEMVTETVVIPPSKLNFSIDTVLNWLKGLPKEKLYGFAAALVLVLIVLIVVLVRKARRRKRYRPVSFSPSLDEGTQTQQKASLEKGADETDSSGEEDATEYLGADADDRTELIFRNGAGYQGRKRGWAVCASDLKYEEKTFRCELNGKVLIGRGKDCDIRIDYEPSVSSRHCSISGENGEFFVEDLNSSNGTFLNDVQICKKTKILDGDILKLGRTELKIIFRQE